MQYFWSLFAKVALAAPSASPNPTPTLNEGFGTYIQVYLANLYTWSIGVAGLLAIIMLIYAGYTYVTSQGNPDSINQAKEMIIGSLGGLLLLILAGLVLSMLGVATLKAPGAP